MLLKVMDRYFNNYFRFLRVRNIWYPWILNYWITWGLRCSNNEIYEANMLKSSEKQGQGL